VHIARKMCARYTMAVGPDELIEELEATLVSEVTPRYNIAPTQDAPIVIQSKEGERRLGLARFGLVPHWAKDATIGARLLNARVETVAEKPAYRAAFAKRRCLVAADGFYEWLARGKQKIPFHFRLPGSRPFAMAGLWSLWRDAEGRRTSSFTILTREAVGATAEIHERMPIVLPCAAYGPWLDRAPRSTDETLSILGAHRGEELEGYEVSRRVNRVANDEPSLVVPVEA